MVTNNKIDFVITWVDGSDINWLNKKKRYQPDLDVMDSSCRYRDWNNLQYLFRGIEKFAPWVHKVHLITDSQIPTWLNTKHPKLNIVTHEEYIPSEYLPTFNSRTIELNLHRLEELSNQFVLFNDDMFIIDYLDEKDCFVDGIPVDSAILGILSPSNKSPINFAIYNNVSVINDHFSKKKVLYKNIKGWFSPKYGIHLLRNIALSPWSRFSSFYNYHLPQNYLKKTFNELWKKESELLHKTSLNKFREKGDLNQWVFRYWQLAQNKFVPKNLSKRGNLFSVQNEQDVDAIKKYILGQKGKMICINDNENLSEENFHSFSQSINGYLHSLLPEKSGFEI